MSNRMFYPLRGSLNREVVSLYGVITTTTSGTINSAASTLCKGFSVAKSGTGQYTITLQDQYAALLQLDVSLLVATVTATRGQVVTISSQNMATKTIVIKIYRPDTQVVAEVTDATVIRFSMDLSRVALTN
jgi:hypothetical protein